MFLHLIQKSVLTLGMENVGIQTLCCTFSIRVTDFLSADRVGMRYRIRILNGVKTMLTRGKFLVYASRLSAQKGRLKTVGRAVVRVAESLGADIEVYQREDVLSIFVYYKNGVKEKIPVYCDWSKNWSEEEVYHAVKSVIYALSFHPEYTVLQTIRKR